MGEEKKNLQRKGTFSEGAFESIQAFVFPLGKQTKAEKQAKVTYSVLFQFSFCHNTLL